MAEIRKVVLNEMEEHAKKLDSLIGEWADAVNQITKLVEDLNTMWDGLANDSFNARWAEDLVKYGKLQLVMEEYRRAITDAMTKYAEYEQEIDNIVKTN